MLKLLNAYEANPTLKTAKAVQLYAYKHPFSGCLLKPEDCEVLAEAMWTAREGK